MAAMTLVHLSAVGGSASVLAALGYRMPSIRLILRDRLRHKAGLKRQEMVMKMFDQTMKVFDQSKDPAVFEFCARVVEAAGQGRR